MFGLEGWGFAILREGSGAYFSTTEVLLRAEVRANGYPSRLYFSFLSQEWVWKIAPMVSVRAQNGRTRSQSSVPKES